MSDNVYSIRLMETFYGALCSGGGFLIALWILCRTRHRSTGLWVVTVAFAMTAVGPMLVHHGIKFEAYMFSAWGGGLNLCGKLLLIYKAGSHAIDLLQAHELWWDVREKANDIPLARVSVWKVRFQSLRKLGQRHDTEDAQ